MKLENLGYVLAALLAAILGFLAAYMKEKGKNYANKEDFDSLKLQLTATTELVENVKVSVSDKSWVGQQVWLKKQEAYEFIFEQLAHVKKFIHFQVTEFEAEEYLKSHHPYVQNSQYASDALSQQWNRDVAELERRQKYNEEHNLFENLKSYSNDALSKTIDSVTIKSMYLNFEVEEILVSLQRDISSPHEDEDESEFYYRIDESMEKALVKLYEIAKVELQLPEI